MGGAVWAWFDLERTKGVINLLVEAMTKNFGYPPDFSVIQLVDPIEKWDTSICHQKMMPAQPTTERVGLAVMVCVCISP